MVHSIKCLPEYFEALRKGIKNFEVRKKRPSLCSWGLSCY